jgi:steroid delta-isomerase-like uncharacterized protein
MGNDNSQLVEQHMKAWSSGDVDGIVSCFTEDCIFEDLALQATFEGHVGLREFAVAVLAAVPDFQWPATRMFAEGAQVCTEWRFTGTQTGDLPGIPATGKSVDIPGVTVDEIRNGRIHRHRDYWSLATYLQQVGLMPSPES